MARKSKSGDYSYTRTALIRGLECNGRYAVIQLDRDYTRVVPIRPDGSANGEGFPVNTSDVLDLKLTQVVPTGQRGTITLPGEFRRNLGIEEGTPLEITQEEDGRLSLRPLSRVCNENAGTRLDDLVSRITPENLHGEWQTGPAVGREEW